MILGVTPLNTCGRVERLRCYPDVVLRHARKSVVMQQNALQKLLNLEIYTEDVLRSLTYGLGSHRWQFVKFSKDNIRKLLKDKKYREIFVKIRADLPIREKTQLQRLLEE